MGNCFSSKNKFEMLQKRDEYKNRKVNMTVLGKYKPKQVFIGDEFTLTPISGLNGM